MAPEWDPELARRKLRQQPEVLVCDALLDQDVFAGVGNIIKNEVLFRIRVHPASEVGALPPRLLGRMIREGRDYSFQFLEWKQRYVLRQHWLVHNKSQCAECGGMLTRQHMGARNRRTFYCERCQPLYPPPA